MKISQDFIRIIGEAKIEEKNIILQSQLTRKEYTDFMKVAELLGLKWSIKDKCHIYEGEGSLHDALEEVLEIGEVVDIKKLFQQYYTPTELAKRAVGLAEIKERDLVLEPSAGQGAILKQILNYVPSCKYCEIDHVNQQILGMIVGANEVGCDFLEHIEPERKYNKIIMNPPFAKSQDVKHILHAYSLLAEGGKLVAIAPISIKTKEQNLYKQLRDLNPKFIDIEDGAFKESDTMVKTCFVILEK